MEYSTQNTVSTVWLMVKLHWISVLFTPFLVAQHKILQLVVQCMPQLCTLCTEMYLWVSIVFEVALRESVSVPYAKQAFDSAIRSLFHQISLSQHLLGATTRADLPYTLFRSNLIWLQCDTKWLKRLLLSYSTAYITHSTCMYIVQFYLGEHVVMIVVYLSLCH